jgi:arylsulfatase A-like enzyme
MRRVLGVASALVGLAAAACGAPDAVLSGYNLVLVNIDSLRADHLGCYGYRRDTSPFLDGVAGEGVLFERVLASSSFTRESVATLLTGRLPTSGGSVGWDAAPAEAAPTLAQRLGEAGYRTGFFSNTVMLSDLRFTRGFEERRHLAESWGVSGMGPALSRRAAEFMKRHAREKFMLYLHYLDPHGPYDPSPEAYARFSREPFPAPLGLYGEVRPQLGALVRDGFGPGDPRFEDLVLRYDVEVFRTDGALRTLFASLRALGLARRTLVVISADHGEEFLEHGFVEHGWTLYRESLHVPLVFWAAGSLEPRRVPQRASSADVAPTILSLLGIAPRGGFPDGRPLLGPDGATAPEADAPVISELLLGERNVLRSVVQGDWKYVAAYRWLPPEARPAAAAAEEALRARRTGPAAAPWRGVVREELYQLAEDPAETRNVLERFPEQAAALRGRLDAYRARCQRDGLAPERSSAAEASAAERERLRALGYVGGGSER